MNMSVVKIASWVVFSLNSFSASVSADCLSENTVKRLEETVFAGASYKDLDVRGGSGEVNLDIGYSFARTGDLILVKHFRPNFVFTYLVTLLETGSLIEANFHSYGIIENENREESYLIFYKKEDDQIIVLCGENSVGALTVDPVTSVLPELVRESSK